MHPAALKVRNRAARELLSRTLPVTPRTDLVRLGSDYGGWWVPRGLPRPDAVAYCAGAGEDITFDLALHEAGYRVTTFDPTPRAIAHVETHRPAGERFRFVPTGWWSSEDVLRFYAPRNPLDVSHSALNLQGTHDFFEASVKPVAQLMGELGDPVVDLVKMDIEGAEYEVLRSLRERGPQPAVLCIEFDQPQPLRRLRRAVEDLIALGYELNKIEGWNYTFTRRHH